MKKSSTFKPKADVEEYLDNGFNYQLYLKLTEDFSTLKALFPEPLIFFNLLYEQLHFINANKAKPLTVKRHLEALSIEPVEKKTLLAWIKSYIWETNIIQDEKLTIIDEQIHNIALVIGEIEGELNLLLQAQCKHEVKKKQDSTAKPSNSTHKALQHGIDPIWWTGTKQSLESLIQKLIQEYLIQKPKKNEYPIIAHFVDAEQEPFADKPTYPQSFKSIWWKSSQRLLHYLFDQLQKESLIAPESKILKHIREHFVDQYKKPIGQSIKQNAASYYSPPKGAKRIDDIIKELTKIVK